MSVVSAITAVFTEILTFFTTAIGSISGIFYDPEAGFTFVGVVTLISLGIGVITMLIATIRSLVKGRG